MGVVSDVEGAARRFWIRSHRESVFAAYTPFVVCLASGSLELDTFRHYIAQDAYFLRAFAQAYEMAEKCADDDDAKEAIFHLRRDVLEELKLHNSFAEDLSGNSSQAMMLGYGRDTPWIWQGYKVYKKKKGVKHGM